MLQRLRQSFPRRRYDLSILHHKQPFWFSTTFSLFESKSEPQSSLEDPILLPAITARASLEAMTSPYTRTTRSLFPTHSLLQLSTPEITHCQSERASTHLGGLLCRPSVIWNNHRSDEPLMVRFHFRPFFWMFFNARLYPNFIPPRHVHCTG